MESLILASYVLRSNALPERPRAESAIRSYYRRAFAGTVPVIALGAVAGLGVAAGFLV